MGLFKKKKVNSLSPFDLDWGEITPDIYNGETNEAFHICNHYHISGKDVTYLEYSLQVELSGIILIYLKKARIIYDLILEVKIKYLLKFNNIENGKNKFRLL
jgi:hypothetical protein